MFSTILSYRYVTNRIFSDFAIYPIEIWTKFICITYKTHLSLTILYDVHFGEINWVGCMRGAVFLFCWRAYITHQSLQRNISCKYPVDWFTYVHFVYIIHIFICTHNFIWETYTRIRGEWKIGVRFVCEIRKIDTGKWKIYTYGDWRDVSCLSFGQNIRRAKISYSCLNKYEMCVCVLCVLGGFPTPGFSGKLARFPTCFSNWRTLSGMFRLLCSLYWKILLYRVNEKCIWIIYEHMFISRS